MEMERIVRLLLHIWTQIWTSNQSFSTETDDNAQLKRLKTRYNYASSDCAARIISSNPGALNPAAILSSSKETSLRNLCSTPEKFAIIELCQEIKPEALVVANYELFSSTLKHFTVFGSRSLDIPVKDWSLLGEFEAKSVHRDQVFSLEPNLVRGHFIKYLRISFDSHHGREHFCPVSSVRVYGKTMLEEFNDEDNSDNLPVLSNATEEAQLSRLATELHQVRQEIDRIEYFDSFLYNCTHNTTLSQPAHCNDNEEALNTLKSRAVFLESETLSLSDQIGRRRPGNVYRDLSVRLKKLESILPVSLGNIQILLPSQRSEQSRPQISASPAQEFPVFDLKQLQTQLNIQQFWINALLTANLLLFVSVLACLLLLLRRQPKFDNASKSGELKRLPLSALKSPGLSSNSSSSSHSSLPSLNNPGVVLSDDEFMMGDSVVRSDGSILFSRRSVDRMQ